PARPDCWRGPSSSRTSTTTSRTALRLLMRLRIAGRAGTSPPASCDPHPRGRDRMSLDRLARVSPAVRWLPRYERRWLRGDVTAGLAVTALVVPKNLGYAGIAGVPLQNGLYAAAAGASVYPPFCTSRQLSTGPS